MVGTVRPNYSTLNVLEQPMDAANIDNKLYINGSWYINDVQVNATADQLNSLSLSLTVANKTGGALTKGTLVYFSGYDTTLAAPSVTKADADSPASIATLVLAEDIANDASGIAEGEGVVAGLDTSSYSAVGSLVYLSGTAGETTPTAPTAADDVVQIVGVVKVKHASTGSIYFFPGYGFIPTTQYLTGITPGTVAASQAVVVDSNKDIGDFRNLDAVNIDAGASGTAGTVDIFPTTALKGKIAIAATANTNNDALSITNAAHGQATTLTIPDGGQATANFVLSEGTATIAGAKTFSSAVTVTPTTNQLVLGVTNTTTINSVAPAASRTHQISDVAGNGFFALLGAAPTAIIGSTPAEIDLQCDISLQTETIAESGVVSVTKRITNILSTGAGAVTLAAPDATMIGQVKTIQMTGGEHDITLALTNIQGQSSGTTATFSDTNDTLVLVGGTNKWTVIGEAGIALS